MEYKSKLIKAIKYHYPEAKIYLFGSWAKGTNQPSSDIDLAIDVGEAADFYELSRLKNTIENLDLPIKVDVVDLGRADEKFINRIQSEMIQWSD